MIFEFAKIFPSPTIFHESKSEESSSPVVLNRITGSLVIMLWGGHGDGGQVKKQHCMYNSPHPKFKCCSVVPENYAILVTPPQGI